MGACCSMRDRTDGFKEITPQDLSGKPTKSGPALLHVLNGKKDYRLARVLRLILEPHGKVLEVRETALLELPETGLKVHPILEYEGKALSGEVAITQYVARCEMCYPLDPDPLLLYDLESLVAEVIDLWDQIAEGNEETVNGLMGAVERRLGEDGGHFVGSRRTLADVYVYDFLKKCFVGAKVSSLPARLITFIQKFEAEHHLSLITRSTPPQPGERQLL